MYNFPANVQTLLALAWLASQKKCRETVIEAVVSSQTDVIYERRVDGKKMITGLLEGELNPLVGEHICAPTFIRLLRHQFARIEMDYLEWALFGKNAIYFQPDALPRTPDDAKNEFAAQAETSILLEALQAQEGLPSYLRGVLQTWLVDNATDKSRGALLLRTFFADCARLLIPLSPGNFLVPELLRMSFEQIDWEAVTAFAFRL